MFTRNWYNYFASQFVKKIISDEIGKVKDRNGDIFNSGNYDSGWDSFRMGDLTIQTSYTYAGFIFGDGDDEATIDDYKLSGNLITTISGSVSNTTIVENNKVKKTYIITLTNTSNSSITIKECAITKALYTSSTASSFKMCIVNRCVLDTPVVIPAGGVGVVDYAIEFEYPPM